MHDWEVSLTAVVAAALWVLAVTFGVIQLVSDARCGALAGVSAAGAATLNVRSYFVRLEKRELNAFELGRDYEESRRVHSVH